ncbi:hypothetical protein M5U04_16895 [Xenorhabdus sp. XENO-1]|uniref:hypothetical protein n=1 Tax=Xenorhabdus bovienii TaxID=40576 RepID=UPI0020CA71A5|nr:hypothetical protein [Xenorhabdus bovienii]MCP9269714.1 hypothetical protein [Xenorhabdus bovienii subsp. africana]
MNDSDVIREAFEKFLLTEFRYFENALEKDENGVYYNMPAQNYWEIFQAAWKASKEKLAEYENMEPVGYFYQDSAGLIGKVPDEYKNDDAVFPLYRRSNHIEKPHE